MPNPQDPWDAVELTRSLVGINSENPTGSEAEMAAFVSGRLRELPRVEVQVVEVQPGRPNVIARLAGSSDLCPLAFVAHMDTVPFGAGWQRSPTSGDIVDGKLFGRGSCDMKSGLAVAMSALAHAAMRGGEPKRTLMVCATMDEEGAQMQGVNHLVDTGVLDARAWVIATEPSDLKVIVAHKGLVWIEVEVHGRSAHAGNPQVGVDAIRAAGEFIVELKRLVDAIGHNHPRLGRTEVTFSGFVGGIKTNVVPEYARLELDIRVPPPLGVADVHSLIAQASRAAEARVPGSRFSHRQFNNDRPPVEADVDGEFAQTLLGCVQTVVGGEPETAIIPAYTDASVAQARTGNRNCLVFGPGRLTEAHITDEYVPVRHIEQAVRVLDELVGRTVFRARDA